ncbi:6-carboxytetrahydropterin synthase [Cytophagaceae bacterium ABcell3]|nr:6-carboxytetrahydropterin synthase [Cytophagaceae bacterium ABcell3]
MSTKHSFIRLTKIFEFQTAHCLFNYEGACRNIHGHSYKLYVTVGGKAAQLPAQPNDGMLVDFKLLKTIVQRHVIDLLDHALVLNEAMPKKHLEAIESLGVKVNLFPFQPTCENLIGYIAKVVQEHLPEEVVLKSLKLYETETSYAEWLIEDNF